MKLSPFAEWFAVRIDHSDEEIWTGRIDYDPVKKLTLEVVGHTDLGGMYENPTLEKPTITGYLDFQQIATLVGPIVTKAGGGRFGKHFVGIRGKFSVTAALLLKNVHLADINSQSFKGYSIQNDAVRVWFNPNQVKAEQSFDSEMGSWFQRVSIDKGEAAETRTRAGIIASMAQAVALGKGRLSHHLDERVRLDIVFPTSVKLDDVLQSERKLISVLDFLIGVPLEEAVLYLAPASQADSKAIGFDIELWGVSAFKRVSEIPHPLSCFFNEQFSPIGGLEIARRTIDGDFDQIVPLMNAVVRTEMLDYSVVESFSGIVNSLEAFD